MTGSCDLMPAERYWVLLCAATGRVVGAGDARRSAGAVLLGLRDLQAMSCVAPNRRGELEPFGGAERRKHANSLLMAVFDKRLSEREWVDRLCLSPTSRILRSYLEELAESVARKAGVRLVARRGIAGLFSRTRMVDVSDPALIQAVGQSLSWLATPGKGRASVLRMLILAGVAERLRDVNGEAVSVAFSLHEGSREWCSCEEVVAAVENAAFMGSTLSGAL